MLKNIPKWLCVVVAIAARLSASFAQDVHYVQFDATPLAVNPAFTGMFDGSIRGSSIYRNQWANVPVPYVTYGTSLDMPVFIGMKGNYLAAGAQFFQDLAGDGNLRNQSSLASVAYHRHFGKRENRGCDIGIGAQGFYTSKSINVTNLFYNNEYPQYWVFSPTHSGVIHSIQSYYGWNIGLCFSQAVSSNFNYTIGLSESNINQPNEIAKKKNYLWAGLNRSTTGTIGVNWVLNRWAFRPSFYFIAREKLTAFIAGNEFSYILNKPQQNKMPTNVFIGGWYRRGEIWSLTAGVEFKCIRIGVGYDYKFPIFHAGSHGDGGLEISLKYIAPTKMLFSHKRGFPG